MQHALSHLCRCGPQNGSQLPGDVWLCHFGSTGGLLGRGGVRRLRGRGGLGVLRPLLLAFRSAADSRCQRCRRLCSTLLVLRLAIHVWLRAWGASVVACLWRWLAGRFAQHGILGLALLARLLARRCSCWCLFSHHSVLIALISCRLAALRHGGGGDGEMRTRRGRALARDPKFPDWVLNFCQPMARRWAAGPAHARAPALGALGGCHGA